ncbi:hypothetical protein [Streptomyces sp. MZ04]|uniref:hypothetical protein n=1 Tax=Streptomyces sp. MZ04 TaxID=2559236 RepID=UPI001ADFCBF8|nr:hypothetical protein [Streptomyces sp. MZ04]
MSFVMVAAALYGVLQLALLASPVRSLRLSTVLLTVAVGAYGSGVVATLIELGYAHAAVSQAGQPLREAMGEGAYTVVPVVEELAKLAPLLLVGLNLKIRYQLGLADYVVLGAATGAGLGLFEVMLSHLLDAQRANPLPGGGWMLSGGLGLGGATYIPGWSTVLTTWLPASLGSLDMSFTEASLGTSLHLAWGAVGALGAGLLLRGLGWRRLLGLLPIAYAIGHHTLVNYSGQRDDHPSDWADSLLKTADDVVGYVPLICLVIAMAVDYRQLWRSKQAMPAVLLDAERAGRTGMTALTGFGMWCVPWTALIALRFARLRRALLYAAGRTRPERLEALYQAVVDTAGRMGAASHDSAWDATRIRAHLKAARPTHPWRRRWPLLLISLLLMLPSLIFLGIGSFTATKDLQEHFTTGNGPRILMWFGTAALAWVLIQLALLLRASRTTARQPLAEPQAVLRLRVITALGTTLTTSLLLISHYRGIPLDGEATGSLAMLLAALENLELYAGIALTILSLVALIMVFPPGGLALAGGGVLAGAATVEAAQAAALGTAGIALMAQGANGGRGGSNAGPGGRSGGKNKPSKSTKKTAEELNWSENSRPTFGHTFSQHGAGARNTKSLTDRARSTGKDQGQWADNGKAADFLKAHHNPEAKAVDVPIPKGMGQVITPRGEIVDATHARLVMKPDGSYRTAFPILK